MADVELAELAIEVAVEGIALGVVAARGCAVTPSPPELLAAIDEAVAAAAEDDERKAAVRDMLRHGRYKPTGRGKPACEYLLRGAREARFPQINNLVDALNLVSLRSMLPISLVDVARADATRFILRRGRADESYVFNAGGQTIGLEDLLLLAALPDDRACGNPVKDSMATKLTDDSSDVLAVIYAPSVLAEAAAAAAADLAAGLSRWGAAGEVSHALAAAH